MRYTYSHMDRTRRKKAYELGHVRGVRLSGSIGDFAPSQVIQEDADATPFESVLVENWGNPVTDELIKISANGCVSYLKNSLGFSDEEIKDCYRLGVTAVINRRDSLMPECRCNEVEIDQERLEARRRRGRAIRLKERSMRQSKSQTLV